MRGILNRAWPLIVVAALAGCFSASGDEEVALPPPPFAVDNSITPDSFLVFENTFEKDGQSQISSRAYADAYFAAVDPYGERTTLAAWKAVNGFDNGEDVHVTFRDSKDLGYGRDMYARERIDGGIAIYADNYLVELRPGDATSYGPINLAAAVAKDAEFHITTSALEFSPVNQDDPDSRKIVKLFLYGPPDANGNQTLLKREDLDGRGNKILPTACFACHGGNAYPLNTDGSFPMDSLRSLKMNLLDPQTFEFGELDVAAQQRGIKAINRMIFQSYDEMTPRDEQAEQETGVWNTTFAREVAAGSYGGDDFTRDTFDNDFVPLGWRRRLDRPESVEQLYTEVVRPHCIGCHSLRGNNTAEKYAINRISLPESTRIAWSESQSGDLSGNPGAPTLVAISAGTNTITGTVGAPDERDYFTFNVETYQLLTSIKLIEYIDVNSGGDGNTGYAHIDDGPASVDPDESPMDFLGGVLTTSDLVGENILVIMADPNSGCGVDVFCGGIGFEVPLGPGIYTFNIQQLGDELTAYSLNFELSEEVSLANAVNFSSYEKFISYNDTIIDKVYRRGNMPMSLINYSRFWANPDGPPTFLAAFLEGFDVFDAGGRIAPPGRPVPLPGDHRTVHSPVVQDANATLFADSFDWQLVSMPVNAAPRLDNANTAAVTLETETEGEYVLRLTAENAIGVNSAEITLTIGDMLTCQNELTFGDVREVLDDPNLLGGRACSDCHVSASTEFPGIPVVFTDSNPTLYKDVLERVNLREAENSILLRKPTSLQHGGGIVLDRSSSNYITLLNWIRNGAPLDEPGFCDDQG